MPDDSEASRHYACSAPRPGPPPAPAADFRGRPGDEPLNLRHRPVEPELLIAYYRNGYMILPLR